MKFSATIYQGLQGGRQGFSVTITLFHMTPTGKGPLMGLGEEGDEIAGVPIRVGIGT